MKLLVTIPGIGDANFNSKIKFLDNNIKKIKETFSGEVDFLFFNYSNNNFYNIEKDEKIKVVKKSGIIGEFILNDLNPEHLPAYNYIILMVDDIEILNINIDKMIEIYNTNNFNILSPCLTKDSKLSHSGFMKESKHFENNIRVVNFCEYFFYLMDIKTYSKYWGLIDDKTYWLWGIDLCLDKQGFKMGIINNFKIKHYYSNSYKSNLPSPIKELQDKAKKFGRISEMKNISKINYE